MPSAPLSETAQDYLKEIYKLQTESGLVETSALAERVGVAPPSEIGRASCRERV